MLRNIVKKVINEIFDNLELPEGLELIKKEGVFLYKFKTSKNNYCVLFEIYNSFSKNTPSQLAALTKDDKINDLIISHNNAFYLNWGLCDNKSYVPFDDVNTNSKEELYVFNSVFAIINKFFKENSPNIVFYRAIDKRKLIYDKMFNKMNMSNYEIIYGASNTFIIKKELI